MATEAGRSHRLQQRVRQPDYTTSNKPSSACSVSAHPNEDWTKISDLAERRRIQNRIAQRNYRKKVKRRSETLERRASHPGFSEPVHASTARKRPIKNFASGTRSDSGQALRTLYSEVPILPDERSPIMWPLDDSFCDLDCHEFTWTDTLATPSWNSCATVTDWGPWSSNVQYSPYTHGETSFRSEAMPTLAPVPSSMAQLPPSQTENAFTLDNSCSPTTMGMSLPTPEYRKVFRQADMTSALSTMLFPPDSTVDAPVWCTMSLSPPSEPLSPVACTFDRMRV